MDRETVRVLSCRAPTLLWHCSKCHGSGIFECTELLRANANGKLIDIWLTYRCRRCDHTRNLTVVERTPVRRVPPALLDAAHRNDARIARQLARDLTVIRRSGARVAEGDAFRLSPPTPPPLTGQADLELVLAFPEPLLLRWDSLLAEALTVPRNELRAMLSSGTLTVVASGKPHSLRLHHEITVTLGRDGSI